MQTGTELVLQQTLILNPYISKTRCRRPFIFKTMRSVRSNIQSLKYPRPASGWKDIGIRKIDFVAKPQFIKWILNDPLEDSYLTTNFVQLLVS